MKFLVTGGLGFIGSHVCIDLLKNNHDVIILDNMENSSLLIFNNMQQIIVDSNINSVMSFYNADIINFVQLETIFENNIFDGVFHFAALKSIPESEIISDDYYNVNVNGTLNIIKLMKKYEVYNLIYSSSASIYGNNTYPVSEDSQIGNGINNVYAETKFICENKIKEFSQDPEYEKFSFMVLRYFNPIGAHKSGLLGDRISGNPTNIMPILGKYSLGLTDEVHVFGDDYDTRDGSCIRDFIHINDLSNSHIKVLKFLNVPGIHIYNVGTGEGTSILDLINIYNSSIIDFNKNNKCNLKKIEYTIKNRRNGDLPIVYTYNNKIKTELNFESTETIYNMCYSFINFIYNN